MKVSFEKALRKNGQFIVRGSYGELLIDGKTGEVLHYYCDPSNDDDPDEYSDIVKFDVKEYVKYNGGMDDTDIVLIGFWTNTGFYEPPCYEEREPRNPEICMSYVKD